MGNMEKIAMGLFALYFIEFFIKASTKFKGECFSTPTEDNVLIGPERPQSLTHVIMKLGKFKEQKFVISILALQLAIALLVLVLS
jgi:UDP-N-acetylglucosamine--dolichyl-phosphate N-acetylglucosaminephosphotransferase